MDEERATRNRSEEPASAAPGRVARTMPCRLSLPRCGDTFSCGARADGCWCRALPARLIPPPGRRSGAASCFAPTACGKAVELLRQTV